MDKLYSRKYITVKQRLFIQLFIQLFIYYYFSYLKDTYHFLELIKPMRLWTNTHLFTTDIDSLHTDINTELRPKTIETILKGHRDPKMSSQVDSIYRWRAQQWGIGKPPHMHICTGVSGNRKLWLNALKNQLFFSGIWMTS